MKPCYSGGCSAQHVERHFELENRGGADNDGALDIRRDESGHQQETYEGVHSAILDVDIREGQKQHPERYQQEKEHRCHKEKTLKEAARRQLFERFVTPSFPFTLRFPDGKFCGMMRAK